MSKDIRKNIDALNEALAPNDAVYELDMLVAKINEITEMYPTASDLMAGEPKPLTEDVISRFSMASRVWTSWCLR